MMTPELEKELEVLERNLTAYQGKKQKAVARYEANKTGFYASKVVEVEEDITNCTKAIEAIKSGSPVLLRKVGNNWCEYRRNAA